MLIWRYKHTQESRDRRLESDTKKQNHIRNRARENENRESQKKEKRKLKSMRRRRKVCKMRNPFDAAVIIRELGCYTIGVG